MSRNESNHTTIIPNLLSALTFFAPSVFFLSMKLYLIDAVYQFIIIFLLVLSLSNTKWQNEINKKIDTD